MDVKEAIIKRRAVRSFDKEYKISDKEIEEFISLIRLSPTSFNTQNWRFVAITDMALREELKKVCWNQPSVTEASFLIAFCGDLKAYEKSPERYYKDAAPENTERALPAIKNYYENKEQTQRDEAMRSGSMAAMSAMLLATDMGLDSCPMVGMDFVQVEKILKVPSGHALVMLVAIGKGTGEVRQHPGRIDLKEIFFKNTF